jgi:hypothetical protein
MTINIINSCNFFFKIPISLRGLIEKINQESVFQTNKIKLTQSLIIEKIKHGIERWNEGFWIIKDYNLFS